MGDGTGVGDDDYWSKMLSLDNEQIDEFINPIGFNTTPIKQHTSRAFRQNNHLDLIPDRTIEVQIYNSNLNASSSLINAGL